MSKKEESVFSSLLKAAPEVAADVFRDYDEDAFLAGYAEAPRNDPWALGNYNKGFAVGVPRRRRRRKSKKYYMKLRYMRKVKREAYQWRKLRDRVFMKQYGVGGRLRPLYRRRRYSYRRRR